MTTIRRYPNSTYAGDAHQRMIYLRNQMAEKEILIAKFYVDRQSWLSSAQRAKTVLERYPRTKWTKDALDILLLSYRKLGLNDLAADIQRVINYNDFSDLATTIEPDRYGKAPPSTL